MPLPRLISCLLSLLLFAMPSWAKRATPKEVPPIENNGIRYSAVVWGSDIGEKQNGGFVEAHEIASGKLLWRVKVYSTAYKSGLEKDVQDVFITSLALKNGELIVENEKGEEFAVDLKTRKVRRP